MSHVENPITVGVIEHQADECPAAFPDKAAEVVPALRAAAEAGQVPDTLVFASKSHKGAFAAEGTTAEVESSMPALPLHEARYYDATGDETVHQLIHDATPLQTDEAARHGFIDHVEQRFDEPFPNRHEGPVVPGAELADFIAAKHE
jgi:hypothetical protein